MKNTDSCHIETLQERETNNYLIVQNTVTTDTYTLSLTGVYSLKSADDSAIRAKTDSFAVKKNTFNRLFYSTGSSKENLVEILLVLFE